MGVYLKDKVNQKVQELDFLVINDDISIETVKKLRKAKIFDKNKVVVVIDKVVPANSAIVSKLHKNLKELALENNLDYVYGLETSLTYLLNRDFDSASIVAGSSENVVGICSKGVLGISLDEEKLIEVFESGKVNLDISEIRDLEIVADKKENNRLINFAILDKAKSLNKSILYNLKCENFNSYNDEDLADLIVLLDRIGIKSIVDRNQVSDFSERLEVEVIEKVINGNYDNLIEISSYNDKEIKAVFVGGSSGGSIENIRKIAKSLEGKKVAYGLRLVISANCSRTYIKALKEGLFNILLEAGALVINSCASADVQSRIGREEIMISTDFKTGIEYAGLENSKVLLGSIDLAIDAVINGKICVNNTDKKEEVVKNIKGKVWIFGDDIDTDIIIPTQYLNLPMDEMLSHAFEPLKLDLASKIKSGDILVAANNFGCGSSREQAAEVIANLGIKVIIAKSFARIFFRNAINNGILLIENDQIYKYAKDGDEVEVAINEYIKHKGEKYSIGKVQNNLLKIIYDGGLVKNVEKRVKNGEL